MDGGEDSGRKDFWLSILSSKEGMVEDREEAGLRLSKDKITTEFNDNNWL